jgi:hypothetical protein
LLNVALSNRLVFLSGMPPSNLKFAKLNVNLAD